MTRRSRSSADTAGRLLKLGLAAGAATMFALPIVWLLASSFRSANETFSVSSPPTWHILWPAEATLDNFHKMVDAGFLRNVWNSLLVAGLTTSFGLLICSLAAFALAAIEFRGREVVFAIVVVSFLIPFEAIAIPLSTQFRSWGLANTVIGLVLPGLANGLAVFSLRQFFLAIPGELKEAAEVDGAGHLRIFARIYVPLAKPAMIGAGLILFLFQWQAYLWPVLITADPAKDLAPVSIARNFNGVRVDYGTTFAEALVISVIPAIVILALQRYFVASVAMSGTKE